MALIAAVFASCIGLLAAVSGAVFFGSTIFESAVIYFCVSLVTMCVFAVSLFLRPRRPEQTPQSFEDAMDADWARYSELEAQRLSPDEEEFQAQLDTPLEVGDMRRGKDRRHADGEPTYDDRRRSGDRRGAK